MAAVAGIPMFANASDVIAIVHASSEGRAAPLGTGVAFIVGVVALSLPEKMILRRVRRPRLIAACAAIVDVSTADASKTWFARRRPNRDWMRPSRR